MSTKRVRVPRYGCHRATGQARVVIDGKHHYLGTHGSPESRERYARLIAESTPANTPPAAESGWLGVSLTINELLLRYWQFASTYYAQNGKPTKELGCMRDALRPLRRLYGSTLADEFGPRSLKTLRDHLIEQDISRGVINARVNRIRRFFRWAVSEELLAPTVLQGLEAVAGLRYGRTSARETEPVRPVPDELVDAVLPYVSPQVAAMIQLQRLTGMRPCEVVIMRICDIDQTRDVWVYEPETHKNRWRGHRRLIPLGPRSQAILRPFMDRDDQAYLFSPMEAEAERNRRRSEKRRTKVPPSQSGRRRRKKGARPKRSNYDVDSYRRAITYGIRRAGVAHWYPLQLRHSCATEIRRLHGLEAAQAALGHVRADVTEIYAEKNLELAIRIAEKNG